MNWINIKDRQPEEDQEIIAAVYVEKGIDIDIGFARQNNGVYDYIEDGEWMIMYAEGKPKEIKYWIPIEDLTSTLPK